MTFPVLVLPSLLNRDATIKRMLGGVGMDGGMLHPNDPLKMTPTTDPSTRVTKELVMIPADHQNLSRTLPRLEHLEVVAAGET